MVLPDETYNEDTPPIQTDTDADYDLKTFYVNDSSNGTYQYTHKVSYSTIEDTAYFIFVTNGYGSSHVHDNWSTRTNVSPLTN